MENPRGAPRAPLLALMLLLPLAAAASTYDLGQQRDEDSDVIDSGTYGMGQDYGGRGTYGFGEGAGEGGVRDPDEILRGQAERNVRAEDFTTREFDSYNVERTRQARSNALYRRYQAERMLADPSRKLTPESAKALRDIIDSANLKAGALEQQAQYQERAAKLGAEQQKATKADRVDEEYRRLKDQAEARGEGTTYGVHGGSGAFFKQ